MSQSLHPSQSMMEEFCAGKLDPGLSALVAAHLADCSACRKLAAQIETHLAQSCLEIPSQAAVPDFSKIEQDILELPASGRNLQIRDLSAQTLTVKGKSVDLPAPLSTLKKAMAPWRSVGRNISYSKVDVEGAGNLYFLYFENGAEIPEHTHDGNEYALVVAGSFRDQHSEYITGDFATFSTSDSHRPSTEDPDGCLLLVSLEGPFVFKEGWARLLNPFRRWLF